MRRRPLLGHFAHYEGISDRGIQSKCGDRRRREYDGRRQIAVLTIEPLGSRVEVYLWSARCRLSIPLKECGDRIPTQRLAKCHVLDPRAMTVMSITETVLQFGSVEPGLTNCTDRGSSTTNALSVANK